MIVFFCDFFVGVHDETSSIKLFESGHHGDTDKYPFSAGGSYSLSRSVGGFLGNILIMIRSNSKCILNSIFDVEEGS